MLPDITLDDQRFEQLMEMIREQIPTIQPEWTDFNYHDPGITLLELFAWLKEMQQYHMNQISEEARRKYLRLLGISPRNRQPATAQLQLIAEEKGLLLRGSRFFADEIPFETTETIRLQPNAICEAVRTSAEGRVSHFSVSKGGDVKAVVFGEQPQVGASFSIGIANPLEVDQPCRLSFCMRDDYPVKRNPIPSDVDFIPLARIRVELCTAWGFVPADIIEDTTHELLFSGSMTFRFSQPMVEENGLYWIRLVLEEAGYDTAPQVERLSLSSVEVEQTCTLSLCREKTVQDGSIILSDSLAVWGEIEVLFSSELGFVFYEGTIQRTLENGLVRLTMNPPLENGKTVQVLCIDPAFRRESILGEGTGFAYQMFELPRDKVRKQGFALMVETMPDSGCYERWEQVESLDASNKEQAHYCIEDGFVCFGDCFKGRAPEGRILITDCQTTLGVDGNVRPNTIRWEGGFGSVVWAENPSAAKGGTAEETIAMCAERVRNWLAQTERAVTAEDYEELVLRTAGLRVQSTRAIPACALSPQESEDRETQIALAVMPYSEQGNVHASPAFMKNIEQMLEKHRMIGTSIVVLKTELIAISIYVEATSPFYRDNVREQMQSRVSGYFHSLEGSFGCRICYSDIYGVLDTIPEVESITSLEIEAKGKGVQRSWNGDILLPAGGLPRLTEWQCRISAVE